MATPDDTRKQAVERLNAKRAFRTSAVTFAGLSVLFLVIWAVSGAGFFWPAFPIGAFALALAIQAWHLYGEKPITEADIEEEMRRGGGTGV